MIDSVREDPASPDMVSPRPSWRSWLGSGAAREIVFVLLLYGIYSLARLAAQGDFGVATATATDIHRFEHWLGIDIEQSWNRWAAGTPGVAFATALWYATWHFVATIGVLVVLWTRHRPLYRPLFVALAGTTLTALVMFIALPTAPPRLMRGFVDVLEETGRMGFWDRGPQGADGLSSTTNELAAFPSLHAGWSLWVALAVCIMTRRVWLRVVAVSYALITGAVVILTANHWVIDIWAGWAITGVWVVVAMSVYRRRGATVTAGATLAPAAAAA
ncbi:phosphatase PAP2 family protein [Demequina gelatinilytica]|uniref:phosphatase PAP2 family protein n=1 Tax=Demequina gelatinilytica TaxID=1638980 RepID=UPI0012E0840A|nr:phosphatase PAP2 family protein [Demequina gelatinilytica]